MILQKLELKQARVLAKMRQMDVADKMHVTTAAISQWEKGKAKMSDERFEEYCMAIGFEPRDVIHPEEVQDL